MKKKKSENTEVEDGSDLPGYVRTLADQKLDDVFGDHVHSNNGTHLSGGVKDDTLWQNFYNEILPYTATHYDVPKGGVGKGSSLC